PDLLELIERFGADAVRFGILISAPAGNDLLFDDSSCEQGRNFNNKIWNALKLVKMWEANGVALNERTPEDLGEVSFATTWFENRLNEVKQQVEDMYKSFRLSEVLKTVYSLIWDDFCSWYLEWVKPPYGEKIDGHLLSKSMDFFEELMELLHPFMPFVSEEIYHQLRNREDDLCVKQITPAKEVDGSVLQQGKLLQQTITAIREARVKNNIKPKDPIRLAIQSADPKSFGVIEQILSKQVNAESIEFVQEGILNAITVVVGNTKFFIQTETELDTSSQKEQLLKDLEYHKGFLASVEKKLSNERFVQNAKPDVVELERRKKADAEQKIKALEESLASLFE
ncbi:MAG: class I tRNA ligase family protein, partial [Flavisolibacter sp.]